MKNKLIAWIIGTSAVLTLLVMTSVSRSPVLPAANPESSGAINLALREIADHLLRQNNDFKTLIPPIRQEAAGTYLISVGTEIDYFNLRSVVDSTLDRHDILADYRISLLNCENGAVELGFLALTTDENKEVACQEREQDSDCYNIRLALIDSNEVIAVKSPLSPTPQFQWLFLGLAIGIPFIWLFWQRQTPRSNDEAVDTGWHQISELILFHPANQMLKVNDQPIELTFREAKLLQYFYEHRNQVLERDRIMEAVWEDEGVIVGRSLDVFVSRLRKKLKADDRVQISNVHGVGYKLMI